MFEILILDSSEFNDFDCECGTPKGMAKDPKFRIIGGTSVTEPIPWVAYIQLIKNSDADFCTGTDHWYRQTDKFISFRYSLD